MASPESAQFVEAHLSKCPECNELYFSMTVKDESEVNEEEARAKILPLHEVKKKLRKKLIMTAVAALLAIAILVGAGSYVYNYIDRQNKIVHVDYGESQWFTLKDRKEATDVILRMLYSMGFGYDLISVKYAGDPDSLQAYISAKNDMESAKENIKDFGNYMVFYVELETPAWASPFWGLKPSTHYDNLKWVMSRSEGSDTWQGTYVTPDPAPDAIPAE
jgi:hypothetical protein